MSFFIIKRFSFWPIHLYLIISQVSRVLSHKKRIGLIVVTGCCKQILLKATIQLHCIRVKGKERLPFKGSGYKGSEVQGSRVQGSEVQGSSRVGLCADHNRGCAMN